MQRLKKAIKKIAAIGVGVAMLGATMTSALALDLAEYPTPFVDANGVFDDTTALVVGSKAIGEGAASDTLGAISVATSLQYLAKTPVKTTGGTLSVSGGVTEDVPISRGIANDTRFALSWELDDSDVNSLLDTSINFQSKDYDIHEVLVFPKSSPSIETSLTSSDDDYESNVFMEIAKDSIKYYYVFGESLNISKATSDEPLDIKFLGKTLRITALDPSCITGACAGNEFTAYVGSEYFLKAGDTVTVDGKKVTLENVGSGGAIQVNVDGTIEVIPAASTETVNGIEIANRETFYEDTKGERAAQLVIGADATATYADGDSFIGEDEAEPDWVWDIGGLGANVPTVIAEALTGHTGPYLGIENDFIKDDDTDNPAGIGECYDLPNNYASICLDSLTVAEDDYLTLTIEYAAGEDTEKSRHTRSGSSVGTIHIYTPKSETLVIPKDALPWSNDTLNTASDIKTNEIWCQAWDDNVGSVDIYFRDDGFNPNVRWAGTLNSTATKFLELRYGKTKENNVELILNNDTDTNYRLTVDVNGDSTDELSNNVDNFYINFTIDSDAGGNFSKLGSTLSTAEADELNWISSTKSPTITNLGTKDEDHRSTYGIIIRDPKSNGASDQVIMEIPGDQVQANVVVKGQATTVAGGTVAYVPTRIDVNPMIDSEIASPADHQLILVGGPVVNMLTKTFLGAGWDYASGEALIKLMANGDKVALILAGTDAIDTRMACKVLANYDQYTLAGTEAVVAGSISAPTIKV